MVKCQYCTPDWFEESARLYRANPSFPEKLKKLSEKVCYRVKAEPAWGIDQDIIFGTFIEAGKLTKLAFLSEEEAKREANYIMAATPQEWKKILRKESKFLTEFMLGKIKLEKGSKVTVLGLAPHAPTLVEALTQVEIQFPDEMSPDELAKYKSRLEEFRKNLGV
ncbi:MAG: hypothetical protein OEW45_16210 [Deltaproteobacteria bacterium]|nr:hypothetical protein [Deltaproteobacteria bacterium]